MTRAIIGTAGGALLLVMSKIRFRSGDLAKAAAGGCGGQGPTGCHSLAAVRLRLSGAGFTDGTGCGHEAGRRMKRPVSGAARVG